LRISAHRLDHRAHASTCGGRKRGGDAQEIGRSRGGLSTKIHALVDALGNPLRFILTAGQVHDSKQAEALIAGFDFDKLLADKGYDSNRFREVITAAGGEAVMPSNRARSQAIPYDTEVYKERNLVERFFNKIKQCRRVATRYDKLAANYLAFIKLASIRIWLRAYESTP
jgi:transposase